MKKCWKCNQIKDFKEFYTHQTCCKPCSKERSRHRRHEIGSRYLRNRQLKTKYNIDIAGYEQMLYLQNSQCAICEDKAKLVVDHSHSTKKVRGLLCSRCNLALGNFKDSIVTMENAIKYIKKHENI